MLQNRVYKTNFNVLASDVERCPEIQDTWCSKSTLDQYQMIKCISSLTALLVDTGSGWPADRHDFTCQVVYVKGKSKGCIWYRAASKQVASLLLMPPLQQASGRQHFMIYLYCNHTALEASEHVGLLLQIFHCGFKYCKQHKACKTLHMPCRCRYTGGTTVTVKLVYTEW